MSLAQKLRGRARIVAVVVLSGMGLVVPSYASNGAAEASARCPWMNTKLSPAARVSLLLPAMTLDDKIQMVTGIGYFDPSSPNKGASGVIRGNPRLCIPDLVLNDSTAGIGFQQQRTTAFPQGITQASTWDVGLARTLGGVLADEAIRKGVNVILGPGLNMARNPLSGRGFEYAGEDPHLTGQMSAATIKGIQSRPVLATAKHYLLNEQEIDRNTNSSEVDERTVQEIYMPPFEDAVDAGVASVMCAYNRIASVYACENRTYLRKLLKRQLGFDGFVVSDWGATHSTGPAARAGLDMEMPGEGIFGFPEFSPAKWGPSLKAAVLAGKVPMSRLNDMVTRIARPMFTFGLFDHPPLHGRDADGANATDETSLAVATTVAQDGSVLLKNRRRLLPLTRPNQTIAVIGTPATKPGAQLASQGFGSHHVPVFSLDPDVVAPLGAITDRAARNGSTVVFNDGLVPSVAAHTAKSADVAIVFVTDANTELNDRRDLTPRQAVCNPFLSFTQIPNFPVCLPVPTEQDKLVAEVARANPNTVVVLQNGGPLEMPWLGSVRSVVENWYPGEVDGHAIAGLLFGDRNFSGKLPITFPRKLEDGPLRSTSQYPGVKGRDGIPRSTYSEGLLIGYRWYDATKTKPLFPFGFGLSYTRFAYSNLDIRRSRTGATVRATVTNVGRRAGAEIAQLYVGFPPGAGEPPRQLKAFVKTTLRPGQSRRVRFNLTRRDFSVWNTDAHRWRQHPGCYRIRVGRSSADLPLTGTLSRGGRSC